MKNADKFNAVFGLYATELWSMPEGKFLKWLNSESTEAERRWIPVSERLPEEDACYLVTTSGTNNDIIDIAYYTEGIWHKASRIKAWMPLPEPYKEGEQDD